MVKAFQPPFNYCNALMVYQFTFIDSFLSCSLYSAVVHQLHRRDTEVFNVFTNSDITPLITDKLSTFIWYPAFFHATKL